MFFHDFIDYFSHIHSGDELNPETAAVQSVKIFAVLDEDQDTKISKEDFVLKCMEDRALVSWLMDADLPSMKTSGCLVEQSSIVCQPHRPECGRRNIHFLTKNFKVMDSL